MDKAVVAFGEGIHLQIVDLFPPGNLDPGGLHEMIWSRLDCHEYESPMGQPLTLSSYNAGTFTCYIEPTAVGCVLLDMPLFLTAERYVNVPLQRTYMSPLGGLPAELRSVLESTGDN